MLCTIIDIRGDYAYVKYDATGVVSEVAIALLPFGVEVGDRLKFEDLEFTTLKPPQRPPLPSGKGSCPRQWTEEIQHTHKYGKR